MDILNAGKIKKQRDILLLFFIYFEDKIFSNFFCDLYIVLALYLSNLKRRKFKVENNFQRKNNIRFRGVTYQVIFEHHVFSIHCL